MRGDEEFGSVNSDKMEGSKPDGAPLGRALPVADAGSGDESLLGNIYIGKVKNVVKTSTPRYWPRRWKNRIFQPGGKPGSALYRRAEPAMFIRIFWKF